MAKANEPAFPVYENGSGIAPGLTKREYAAIELRVPDSGTDWLDDMIRKARRMKFASDYQQGMVSAWGQHDVTDPYEIASDALLHADALLARLEEDDGGN